jgi:SAM-dependent methyltransferase
VEDWIELNRANWDDRAPIHAASQEYGLDRFVDDPEHLSDVVRFDLPRIGRLEGLVGVHLQCHIGTDTLSLHRLGARMTGLDFSGPSLAVAQDLAARAGAAIRYVQATVDDALTVLEPGSFDLVFTGIGALCWLPDVRRWASIVAGLLRPGGRLFLREGHPMLWATDVGEGGALVVDWPYFERREPDLFDAPETYVAAPHVLEHPRTASWNHGLGEIVTALLEQGMRITMLVEHDSVPWEALPGVMEALPGGEYRLRDRPWRLPHTYTLQAVREA